MEIVDLIAEGEKVVARFKCSGTHLGEWLGVPPTGRRFENIDEIYIFRVLDGKMVSALGVEDNLSRLRHHSPSGLRALKSRRRVPARRAEMQGPERSAGSTDLPERERDARLQEAVA